MALFSVSHDSPLAPAEAWAKLTDWPQHGRWVPLTSVSVPTPPPNGVGTIFLARTAIGGLGFDDPMEIVEWQAPTAGEDGICRLQKRGSVMRGWAELTVTARGTGSRARWREDISVAGLPRFTDPLTAASSKLLFGRVLRKLLDA